MDLTSLKVLGLVADVAKLAANVAGASPDERNGSIATLIVNLVTDLVPLVQKAWTASAEQHDEIMKELADALAAGNAATGSLRGALAQNDADALAALRKKFERTP